MDSRITLIVVNCLSQWSEIQNDLFKITLFNNSPCLQKPFHQQTVYDLGMLPEEPSMHQIGNRILSSHADSYAIWFRKRKGVCMPSEPCISSPPHWMTRLPNRLKWSVIVLIRQHFSSLLLSSNLLRNCLPKEHFYTVICIGWSAWAQEVFSLRIDACWSQCWLHVPFHSNHEPYLFPHVLKNFFMIAWRMLKAWHAHGILLRVFRHAIGVVAFIVHKSSLDCFTRSTDCVPNEGANRLHTNSMESQKYHIWRASIPLSRWQRPFLCWFHHRCFYVHREYCAN